MYRTLFFLKAVLFTKTPRTNYDGIDTGDEFKKNMLDRNIFSGFIFMKLIQ
jgi:hypothetical protein